MKSTPFFLTIFPVPLLVLLLFSPIPSHAEDFNTYANFNTNTSTVAPGDNPEITLFDDFWGIHWDKTWARGDYDLADGNSDNDPWNGYRFSLDTNGKVGIQASATFNYGTMDINAPLDINMHTSQEGGNTSINTDYSIGSGAGFSTSGTTGNILVSFVNQVYFRYVAKIAVLGVNTTWDDPTINYFDLYPIVDQDQDDPPYHTPVLGGLVDVTAQIPNVTAAGTVAQASNLSGDVSSSLRTASSSSSDSILTVSADVGKAITYGTGLPVSIDLDLYHDATDIGFDFHTALFEGPLGAEAKLAQDFAVTMNPAIHLEFDRPVMVQGEAGWTALTHYDAALGDTINISSSDMAHATTTYTMSWQVANDTNIDIDAFMDLTVGAFDVKLGWGLDHKEWGPYSLYHHLFETPTSSISLYDEDWWVHGQDIAGESFALTSIPNLGGMLSDFSDNVTTDNMAARNALGTTIINRNTTPTGDETPDLFTENPDLYGFLAGYINADGTNVDFLEGGARWDLYNLLASYDSNSDESGFDPNNSVFSGYFDFLLDDSIDLGIDFQPMFDDADGDGDSSNDPVIGLFANFYGLDYADAECPDDATFCSTDPQLMTLLSDLNLDHLFGTSFAFLYNDLAGITDLTIYQGDGQGYFDYAYSSLEQYVMDPVPEPATIFLFGSGLLGFGWYRRKRKIA